MLAAHRSAANLCAYQEPVDDGISKAIAVSSWPGPFAGLLKLPPFSAQKDCFGGQGRSALKAARECLSQAHSVKGCTALVIYIALQIAIWKLFQCIIIL